MLLIFVFVCVCVWGGTLGDIKVFLLNLTHEKEIGGKNFGFKTVFYCITVFFTTVICKQKLH